jgi:galactose mutarotase-like enzyme
MMRAPANNYDDTFATGALEPVEGTRFDFTAAEGRALDGDYLDDSFTDLQRGASDGVRGRGAAEVRVSDPAANYGMKVMAISREIKAIQVYAPTGKNFVAIEPQYNLSDPFDARVWGGRDAGVVFLKPGESTTWHVRFEIYGLR